MTDLEIDDCLDRLIDATRDNAVAFHVAAGEVRGEEARVLLLDRALRCVRATAALRATGGEQGRVPRHPGADTAPRPRFAPRDDTAILAETERRESAVIFAYCDALERPLPPEVQEVVAAELERLLASRGSLRVARDRAARRKQSQPA